MPTGFTDSAVWSGLTLPTAIAFGPSGKVFVGEKGGIVKVFDSIADPTPTQVVDLRARLSIAMRAALYDEEPEAVPSDAETYSRLRAA